MFNMQETKWRPHKYDERMTSSGCRETDVERLGVPYSSSAPSAL